MTPISGSVGVVGVAPEQFPEILRVLTDGELDVVGRVEDASNLTLFAHATLDDVSLPCVYKPVRGERPLWDFPDGTLAEREVLAHDIAVAAGWFCVPPTVLRPGPLGEGIVQLWVGPTPDGDDGGPDEEPEAAATGSEPLQDSEFGNDSDDEFESDSEDEDEEAPTSVAQEHELVAILPAREVGPGWLQVFRAREPGGGVLAVCHRDDPRLALLAGFDLVVNNADRKAPHLVPAGGVIYGVDHGLTFHTEDKLRTVLWGWAGEPLPEAVVLGLERLSGWFSGSPEGGPDALLTRAEARALRSRVDALLADPRFPAPPQDRTPIPWPPL